MKATATIRERGGNVEIRIVDDGGRLVIERTAGSTFAALAKCLGDMDPVDDMEIDLMYYDTTSCRRPMQEEARSCV